MQDFGNAVQRQTRHKSERKTECHAKTIRPPACRTSLGGRLSERSGLGNRNRQCQPSKEGEPRQVSELSKLGNRSKQSSPSRLSQPRKQMELSKMSEQAKKGRPATAAKQTKLPEESKQAEQVRQAKQP